MVWRSEGDASERWILNEAQYARRIIPLPDFSAIPEFLRQGKFDNFVDDLEKDISELMEKGEGELVLRTWVTELENKSHPSAAGILWVIGVDKTEGALPMTPNLIAIPINKDKFDKLNNAINNDALSSKLVYETHREIVVEELGKRLLSKTEFDIDSSDLVMALPTKGLHVLDGGWGHESLVWQEGIAKMIDAFADLTSLGIEADQDIPPGKRATDHVFVAQSVMGGFKTSPKNHSKVSPEDIVNQSVLGLEALFETIFKERSDALSVELPKQEAEKAFWQKVMNVFGHSMQGWALANGIMARGVWLNKLERMENWHAKFHLMNMVIIGSDMQGKKEYVGRMKELIGMTHRTSGHVPLQDSDAGLLVCQSGWLMKLSLISEFAHTVGIVPALISGFLGKMGNTLMPNLAHNHSIRKDNAQISMNNRLLRQVGFAILGQEHMNKLRELEGQGRLTMWMGSSDAILTVEEQWLLGIFLQVPGYVETTNHYSGKETMGKFLPVMLKAPRGRKGSYANYMSEFPGIFEKLPDISEVKNRIRNRHRLFKF